MSHEIPPCHHVVGEEILLFPLFIVLNLVVMGRCWMSQPPRLSRKYGASERAHSPDGAAP